MKGWLGLSLLVVLIDQVTKYLADTQLTLHQPLPVMEPVFYLTLAYNYGAAFSFLDDQNGWQRYLFVGIGVVVMAILINWLRTLKPGQGLLAAGLSLVIGGAAGNVIDRLFQPDGHVIDFIQVYIGRWPFPTFNIADSAISVGVGLLLLDAWLESKRGDADALSN